MAEGDQQVNIEVDLQDELSREAQVAARSTEEMTREIRALNRQLLLLDKRATKAALSVAQLNAATAAYHGNGQRMVATTQQLNNNTQNFTRSVQRNNGMLRRQSRQLRQNSREATRGAKAFAHFFKVLDAGGKGLRPRTFLYLALGVAIAGLIAPVLQLGAALSSLAGFLVAVPALIDVMLLSLVTLMVAFKGVGEGFSAAVSGDWQEFYDAIKDLAPAAQHFLKVIRKYRKEFKEIRMAVQQALFDPFAKKLKPLLLAMMPVFMAGMTGIATVTGQTVGDIFDFFSGSKGVASIETLFANARKFMEEFRRATTPIMHGFADLVIATSAAFDRFTVKLFDLGVQFGNWLTKISESGKATEWLDTAMMMGGQFVDLLQSIGRIFLDLSRAAGGMSFSPLQNILDLIEGFTSSAEGQEALKSFFQAMRDIMSALAPVVTALGSAIGTVLVPILRDIVVTLAPFVTEFIQKLGDALETTRPMWGLLAQAVGELLVALTPLLPVLASILTALGSELAVVLIGLAPVVRALLESLGAPLLILFQTIGSLIQAQAPFLVRIFGQVADSLARLSPLIAKVVQLFSDRLGKFIETKLIPLWEKTTPLFMRLVDVLADEFIDALEQIIPMLPDLVDAFFDLALVILDPRFLQTMLDLARTFVLLTPVIVQLTPQLVLLAQLVITALMLTLRLITVLVTGFQNIMMKVGEFLKKLSDAKDKIKDAILGPIEKARDKIEETLGAIERRFQEFVDNAGRIFSNFRPGNIGQNIANAFSFLPGLATGGPAVAGQQYMVGEVGKELYVPGNGGDPRMIGEGGPEQMRFPSDGFVIPNYMVRAMEQAQEGMARELARIDRSSDGTHLSSEDIKALAGVGGRGGETSHTYNVTLKFPRGVGTNASPADIKKAVKEALTEIEQDRKERR